MFLIFILLNLNDSCLAFSFNDVKEKIHKGDFCHINYNFSKTAAIVNPECESVIYINFKTKQIRKLVINSYNPLPRWLSDKIVYVRGSCGTGCSQTVLFVVPSTKIVCPTHEYRIESLNPNGPPDYYNNNPLLIEPHKKIYVCYAEDNVIQVFRMPKKLLTSIRPPKGYYGDDAIIWHHHLVINYHDIHEKLKRVTYYNNEY